MNKNVYDMDNIIEVTVKDTGIGIEKDQLDKMFLRYYQADKSLTRNAEGSGIGLSLTKSMVELHGGTIDIESEIGKGTKFIIKLPKILTDVEKEIFNSNYLDNRIERLNIEFSDIYFK
ncbi:MAG: hypothetical protein GX053_11910 [Tissierella sp.]|nr:hypothetical protein [Tissierella sp.]